MVRWTQKAADWQRAYCPTERGQDKWLQKSLKDYPKILDNARATLYESKKQMPYVQDSFSLLGGCTAYIHRPALGWTVTNNLYPDLKMHRKCRRSLHPHAG